MDRAPLRRRRRPGREVVPTLGSKEAIFSFAQVAVGERRVVAVPEPAYPVYERGALFAGARVVTVPLREETGWLPDLDAFDAWDELAVFWVCYPNNPTAATAPLSFYEELAARAREHGFLVCSDEAYCELWFGERPVSALQVADREHVVVFNTLSKRSSMTGYRSGFVCAPPWIADALRAFRPSVGTAPQEFVQRASVAAWSDEEHVDAVREVYRRKRETLLPALEAAGFRLAGGDATFFLWLAVDEPSETVARRLLERGLLVAPGSFFGPAGEGYVRLASRPDPRPSASAQRRSWRPRDALVPRDDARADSGRETSIARGHRYTWAVAKGHDAREAEARASAGADPADAAPSPPPSPAPPRAPRRSSRTRHSRPRARPRSPRARS